MSVVACPISYILCIVYPRDLLSFPTRRSSDLYRALPLTSLALVDLAIDGERVDAGALTVEASGKRFDFDELTERFDEWWRSEEHTSELRSSRMPSSA